MDGSMVPFHVDNDFQFVGGGLYVGNVRVAHRTALGSGQQQDF